LQRSVLEIAPGGVLRRDGRIRERRIDFGGDMGHPDGAYGTHRPHSRLARARHQTAAIVDDGDAAHIDPVSALRRCVTTG
jgi:hypothetical protein